MYSKYLVSSSVLCGLLNGLDIHGFDIHGFPQVAVFIGLDIFYWCHCHRQSSNISLNQLLPLLLSIFPVIIFSNTSLLIISLTKKKMRKKEKKMLKEKNSRIHENQFYKFPHFMYLFAQWALYRPTLIITCIFQTMIKLWFKTSMADSKAPEER